MPQDSPDRTGEQRGWRTDRWSLVLAVVSIFALPFVAMLALALSTAGGEPRLTRLARRVAIGALLLHTAGYVVYASTR